MADQIASTSCLRRRGARGQSAVETMFMIPLLLLVFMGMYELFTLTFAAQNAHIRAREYVLHNGQFTPDSRRPAAERGGSLTGSGNLEVSGGTPLYVNGNYIVADPGIWGISSSIGGGGGPPDSGWVANSSDRGIPGVVTSSGASGTSVTAFAYICSPTGCP